MIEGYIDQVPIVLLIDSGAMINTVTKEVWQKLVKNKARFVNVKFKCNRQVNAYASNIPSKVLAVFEAWVKINERTKGIHRILCDRGS